MPGRSPDTHLGDVLGTKAGRPFSSADPDLSIRFVVRDILYRKDRRKGEGGLCGGRFTIAGDEIGLRGVEYSFPVLVARSRPPILIIRQGLR